MRLILAGIIVSLLAIQMLARPFHFSPEFVAAWHASHGKAIPTAKPEIVRPQPTASIEVQPQPEINKLWISQRQLYRTLDCAALVYATARIYARYTRSQRQADYACSRLYPAWYRSVHAKGNFALEVGVIALETLFYKTIFKLILLCGTGDLSDLAHEAVVRCKKLFFA